MLPLFLSLKHLDKQLLPGSIPFQPGHFAESELVDFFFFFLPLSLLLLVRLASLLDLDRGVWTELVTFVAELVLVGSFMYTNDVLFIKK